MKQQYLYKKYAAHFIQIIKSDYIHSGSHGDFVLGHAFWKVLLFYFHSKGKFSLASNGGRFFAVRRSVGRKSLLGAVCPLMTNEPNSGFTYS